MASRPERVSPDSPEFLVGQLFVVGLPAEERLEAVLHRHRAHHFGGVFLRQTNLKSTEKVRRLAHRFRHYTPSIPSPLVCIDEEGGLVTNVAHVTTSAPSAAALGQIDEEDVTRDVYQGIGEKVRALGFNAVFAPVLDVNVQQANPVIGTRSFGSSPGLVSRHGLAAVQGLAAARIACAVKHFPGHGATRLDSHITLPEVGDSRAVLEERELGPFREVLGSDPVPEMVMTAHVAYPALERGGTPATLSPAILRDLLRRDIGYQGLVVTDSMDMKAITGKWEPEKAALRALDAGADLILYALDLDMAVAAYQGVVKAMRAGKISEERIRLSVGRSHRLRRKLQGEHWYSRGEAEEALRFGNEHPFFSAAQKALVVEGNAGVLTDIPQARGPKVFVLPGRLDPHRSLPLDVLREQLEPAGFSILPVDPRPGAEEIGRVERRAAGASVVVVGTASRGPMSEESRRLVEALTHRDVIKVGVALLDPGDADAMMTANCRIKTFGFSAPQLWALSQKLLG